MVVQYRFSALDSWLISRRSSLARHHKSRLPQPGSVIASSYTSPIDSLYLAAIFDPIFTASYPSTRLVQRISLFHAILRAFQHPQREAPPNVKLVDLNNLLEKHPNQAVVVFPECTTTNGRGILQFSTSLLTAASRVKIFPISLRYTAADITTPVPHTYISFLWNLLSKPTHCIRVRIAESVHNTFETPDTRSLNSPGSLSSDDRVSSSETLLGSEDTESTSSAERKILEKVAEALARLGRAKRVGLNVRDKDAFVKTFTRSKRR